MPAARAVRLSSIAIVLGILVFGVAPVASAAQGPVGLGVADSFAVLAGSGITNTGPTTITGDVGTFPTPSQTGFDSVTLNGTNHAADAVTQQAKNDLVSAYDDAAGRSPVTNVPVELGGSTLLAGVYASPTFGLTGTLNLDAAGDSAAQFIFQAGSTLITETNSRVVLLNGADPCRVVWQVGSSATFKAGTRFIGDVLAHTSISALTGATFRGRLLAQNGAVTLDTNTITRASCTAPAVNGATTSTAAPTSSTSPGSQGSATTLATGAGTTSDGAGTAAGSGTGDPAPSRPGSARPPASTGQAGDRGSESGNPPMPAIPFAATGGPTGALGSAGLALVAIGGSTWLVGRRLRPSP
jgi:hypothetical protein